MTVRAAPPLMTANHRYDNYKVIWRANRFEGEAIGVEGQLLRWIFFKRSLN